MCIFCHLLSQFVSVWFHVCVGDALWLLCVCEVTGYVFKCVLSLMFPQLANPVLSCSHTPTHSLSVLVFEPNVVYICSLWLSQSSCDSSDLCLVCRVEVAPTFTRTHLTRQSVRDFCCFLYSSPSKWAFWLGSGDDNYHHSVEFH